ncbi:MAG: LytTR family transcriptional regulator DNA-binding domain-containing protein [Mariniphaga sp.]
MRLKKLIFEKFPQNFIIKHPLYGAMLVAGFTLVFALLYKPLGSHASRFLGYEATMAVYALISGASLFGWINLLVRFSFFSKKAKWTFAKELLAIVILLFALGVVIYFAAFILEEPANRWNFPTFFDSVKNAFLIGIIPFLFFTALNYLYWISPEEKYGTSSDSNNTAAVEELVQISSQLKKESLSFYPSEFIYAESDSNYINFYLISDDKLRKKVIRNSITDVEQQLAHIPYLVRTHRAFIVNLKKIKSKKGNSLGYRLRLQGTDAEIPVSRNNTQNFSELMKQFG